MDAQNLLHRYHNEPGKSVAALAGWRDGSGRSCYEVLACKLTGLARDTAIMDLACGDGYFLSKLDQLGFRNLLGIDQSSAELSAARLRLGSKIELRQSGAHLLPLPNNSLDLITCHLSLMIMEPVPTILDEIKRVLKPRGRFLAVVNRAKRDPAYDLFRDELKAITAAEKLTPLLLGDPRILTRKGIDDLFRPFASEQISLEDFTLEIRARPAQLWASLGLMYDVFRLPPGAHTSLEDLLLQDWQALADEDGLLTCTMGLRLLDVTL